MATFTATAASSTAPARYDATDSVMRIVRYTHPVALSVGDVIQMVRVPNGCNVTAVTFGCSASAGAITVNVGDGNDVSAYAASSVLSGSAMVVSALTYRGLGRSYSAEDTVDFQITVLSAVPGTVDLVMKIEYTNAG